MEELVPVNSVFEPVYMKLGLPESKAVDREANRNHVRTVTVEVPLRIPTNSNPRWNGQEGEEAQKWEQPFNCVLRSSFIQNYANFKRSAEPERLMYYKDGAWIEFSSAVVERAKSAFSQRNPTPEIDVDGNAYIFHFYRMLQIDVVNCAHRSLAWIDVNKRCYFPKFFVDDCVDTCDVPKIEIEIKLENNLSRNKRKRGEGFELEGEDLDTADSSSIGESTKAKIQRVIEPPKGLKWPKARLITEEERAFSAVRDLFLTGMKPYDFGGEVTSIYQFNRAGALEKARWEVFQKQIEITQAARGMANIVFAWHGTSKQGVESILARGFGLPSKVSDKQAYGTGVYLSSTRSPHLSHMLAEADDNGERHVVLCRVILGNTEKVEVGSQQCYPSTVNYDTGVDDFNNPKYYVVWSTNMNTHILPECVISYKCSSRLQESLQAPDLLKSPRNEANPTAARLFAELRQNLPPPKLEALNSLLISYKVGGMKRDTFIKTLRSIAGDGMLRSVMRDIQRS